MKFRALLVKDGQDNPPMQTFHPSLESAKAWANKVLTGNSRVVIYEKTEAMVLVVQPREV